MKTAMRTTLALSLFGFVAAAALPAYAADTCADKMKMVKEEIDKTADAAKKASAEEHYKMAEEAMNKQDEKGCMDHAKMAEDQLK